MAQLENILVDNCNYLIRHKNIAELWQNNIPNGLWKIILEEWILCRNRIDLGTNLDVIDCLGGSVVQCIRSWTSLDMDGRLDFRELREDLKVS